MLKRINVLILLLVLIIILAFPFVASAGTAGNPANVDSPKGSGVFSMKQDRNLAIKTGLDLEFLFERDIKADAATKAKLTSGEWYMARLSYVMFDRIEPYIKLGFAHLEAKWTESGSEVKLESEANFAWGLGGRLLIWEFERSKTKFICDGFYRVADLDADKGYYGGSTVAMDAAKSKFVIREWQIALLASTEIDVSGSNREEFLGVSTIIPYAGIKYSDINGRLRLTQSDSTFYNPGNIESDDIFGIVAGCDFVGPNSVSVNVEGRFLDETALTAGLAILF